MHYFILLGEKYIYAFIFYTKMYKKNGGGSMDFENSETLGEWKKWKATLSKAVNLGEAVGLSDNTIGNVAYRVGSVLTSSVDPENREQRLLQELWKAGDDSDRKALSKMIVKMVQVDDK
jgi:hypothetical protein